MFILYIRVECIESKADRKIYQQLSMHSTLNI